MDKKLLFIINPRSGKGQIRGKLLHIIDIFQNGGYEVIVHPTRDSRDASATAEEYAGKVDLIVCGGGDGTLDEVVSGLMRTGADVPLGYIPSGSTNDFASSLNIPKNMLQAARDIVEGKVFACDVGEFNEDHFAYIAAFGLFTDVSYKTDQTMKNLLGHLAYLVEAGKRIFNVPAYRLKAVSGERTIEGEFVYGMVTNARSVAGIRNIAGKNVEMDDGLFEVTLIYPPKNPLELSEVITSLLSGESKSPLIEYFRTDRIRFESEKEIAWTLDGEEGGSFTCVEIVNRKQALKLILNRTKPKPALHG
jgi:diacylglycerol kinase (ATP)